MPCDTFRKNAGQSLEQRKKEVRATVGALNIALMRGRVKVVVGPQGAVSFSGWAEADRNGVTDACAYRRLMVEGSAIAKAEIAKAERLSGRSINRQVLAAGVHSHDGGQTWNDKG